MDEPKLPPEELDGLPRYVVPAIMQLSPAQVMEDLDAVTSDLPRLAKKNQVKLHPISVSAFKRLPEDQKDRFYPQAQRPAEGTGKRQERRSSQASGPTRKLSPREAKRLKRAAKKHRARAWRQEVGHSSDSPQDTVGTADVSGIVNADPSIA